MGITAVGSLKFVRLVRKPAMVVDMNIFFKELFEKNSVIFDWFQSMLQILHRSFLKIVPKLTSIFMSD